MRILLVGSALLAHDLRSLGHCVFTVGDGGGCDYTLNYPLLLESLLAKLQPHGFIPDICLLHDSGNLPTILGIERMPCPSIFYSVDTYCNPWHAPYAYAFDRVFVAQRDYVPIFEAHIHHDPPAWLPLFATRGPPLPEDFAKRDIPLAFVGTLKPKNIPTRWPFLQACKRLFPIVILQGDYARVFSRTKIVINQTAIGDINYRYFEAMSFGAALLPERNCGGQEDLFTTDIDILEGYERHSAQSAVTIAQRYLATPIKLANIAYAGFERVRTAHTGAARAAFLCHCMETLIQQKAHMTRLNTLTHRATMLATAYGILCTELTDPAMQPHRELYEKMYVACTSAFHNHSVRY